RIAGLVGVVTESLLGFQPGPALYPLTPLCRFFVVKPGKCTGVVFIDFIVHAPGNLLFRQLFPFIKPLV
ncbi:MAG: hypothetical protein U5L72_01940, partial [Bacteroidales bacterium]|nr:hypothetical protein [Bacteroidales bacterium]